MVSTIASVFWRLFAIENSRCYGRYRVIGDLPMNRVKMGAKHEYEYVANYKVMQNVFKAKKIDKVCPILFRYFVMPIYPANYSQFPLRGW